VRVSYALGSDCPAPALFEAELDARLGTGWKAAPDELARSVSVTESVGESGHVVRLDYQDRTGRSIARTTTATTCAEALHQMALITAVAIDAQVPEPTPSAEPVPSAAPAVAPAACPVCPICEPKSPAPVPSTPPLVHELGARFSGGTGYGSSASFGLGAEWGLVAERGLELRVAVVGQSTGDTTASDGRATFRAFTLRADGCFATLALARSVSVPLCVGAEGGVLWAEGILAPPAVTFTRSSAVPVVSGVVAPRLRVATSRVFFEGMPELRVPFIGHTFWFANPQRKAYEIPDLAFGVAISAGARFH
jgi:hypothetical protein